MLGATLERAIPEQEAIQAVIIQEAAMERTLSDREAMVVTGVTMDLTHIMDIITETIKAEATWGTDITHLSSSKIVISNLKASRQVTVAIINIVNQ